MGHNCGKQLVDEYRNIVNQARSRRGDVDLAALCIILQSQGEWTSCGAAHLLSVARQYGTFFLRNRLALATALQIEDGALGL
jgi:hypothetical protein